MIPRTVIIRANAQATRRSAMRHSANRQWQRFQSTASEQSSAYASHVAAGVAGGGVVVLAGYAWYHTSGLKTAVQSAKDVKSYLQSTRDSVVQTAKETAKNPSQALNYLRNVAKQYAGVVPGASGYVDATFDQLDEIHEQHGEEMDKIVSETVDELSKSASSGGADAKTAAKIYEILRKSISQMQELGVKVGGDILDKNPSLKEALGSRYDQLKELADKAGPEGKKLFDEVKKQVKELATKGSLDEDSLKKAKQLLQDKSGEIQELVKSKGGEALQKGGDRLQAVLSAIPGGEEIMEKTPHFKDLVELSSKRSEEAKQLAKETFQDVMKVLEEKGKKAEKLAERTKDDAKQSAKSNN